jgi:hypothetical protein
MCPGTPLQTSSADACFCIIWLFSPENSPSRRPKRGPALPTPRPTICWLPGQWCAHTQCRKSGLWQTSS